ncbi:unnamed protein product [Symbiodinium natans]|uniref:Methyltransferase domain-containing protein n=1 Tax=Symbiodinium natans TaxID=878477 RepID=A0A812NIS9_9DINO|nr:unnamed protein product [Symbiodinium natans]
MALAAPPHVVLRALAPVRRAPVRRAPPPPERPGPGAAVRSCAVAVVLGAAAASPRRRAGSTVRRAVLLDSVADAACFGGTGASDPRDLPQKADPDAPPRGSRALDELPYLIGNAFERRLAVTSRVTGEYEAAPARLWAALSGAEGGLQQSWTALQLTECYGIPWPLQLQEVSGQLEAGSDISGIVGAFGQELRRFRWKVLKAEFVEAAGHLEMLGSVEEEDNAFLHTIRVTGATDSSGSMVESEIRYAPSPPLQTLLNALGGRGSQTASHASTLRKLAVLVDGDVEFDSNLFYNRIGRLIDLVAPFEDGAREAVARLAGLDKGEARVLELGCGTGRWAQGICTSRPSGVARYLGLDSSSTMAEEAARTLGPVPNASVVQADARRPGTLKEACDTMLGGLPDRIVASYIFDIFDEKDLGRVLAQCSELLKASGGLLAVTSVFPGSGLMEAWEAIWQKVPTVVGGCRPKDLAAKLRSFGWEVVSTEVTDVLGYRSQVVLAKPPTS